MKKLIILLLICSTTATFAQKTDYTGTYVLNESKLNLGPAPKALLSKSITIIQTKDSIKIARTQMDGKEVTETNKYDGSAYSRETPNGGKITSVLAWSEDKPFFTLDRKSLNAAGEVGPTVLETWTLEENGKVLKLSRAIAQTNDMKYTVVGYYDKK